MSVNDIELYRSDDGSVQLEVNVRGDTVWLTQAQMAKLFDKERSVITKHIRNVFRDGELEEQSNVQKMHIANSDRPVSYYDLENDDERNRADWATPLGRRSWVG